MEKDNNIISISVKDIINELSNLTGIDEDKIGISTTINIGYWGIHNFDELIELINTNNQKLGYYPYDKDKYFTISIYSNNTKKIHYDLKIKLNLNEKQADGKILKEHCREQLYFVDGPNMHCTGIEIDDIESLNYNVNLEELENVIDTKDFYPSELFKQAIINIIESKNNNKQKVLK